MTRKYKTKAADSPNRGAIEMKPIRKVPSIKEAFPTFIDRETLIDLIQIHWSAMRLIGDDDEVQINCTLPQLIPVTIQIKKGRKVLTKYRVLNGT